MRNYEALLGRIASWLEPGGRFFCHVFSHDRFAYPYDRGWMARTFFTAGTMPSTTSSRASAGPVLERLARVGAALRPHGRGVDRAPRRTPS